MTVTRILVAGMIAISAASLLGIVHLSPVAGVLVFAGAGALAVGTRAGNRRRGQS